MTFCREMKMTYTEYLDQPADVMVRWRQYLDIESEAAEFRRRIDESRAKMQARH
jgi:hypothetical protein